MVLSMVKNEHKMQDNTYLRKVEIYRTNVTEKIMKYDFLCMKFEIKGPNDVMYIKKVAYIFDEISFFMPISSNSGLFFLRSLYIFTGLIPVRIPHGSSLFKIFERIT